MTDAGIRSHEKKQEMLVEKKNTATKWKGSEKWPDPWLSIYTALCEELFWIITNQNIKDRTKRNKIWNHNNRHDLKMQVDTWLAHDEYEDESGKMW
jgi:hypothetical protein